MTISEIIEKVNQVYGNGTKTYSQIIGYLDECIDEINEALYIQLPLFSAIYANTATLLESEDPADFSDNSINNPYTRIPDTYIRNYVCYEVAYRVLRDEDEPQEAYYAKYTYSQRWFQKLKAEFSDYVIEDTEAIIVNGDYDEIVDEDDETTDTDPSDAYWIREI